MDAWFSSRQLGVVFVLGSELLLYFGARNLSPSVHKTKKRIPSRKRNPGSSY
jgi:hypothetical protein